MLTQQTAGFTQFIPEDASFQILLDLANSDKPLKVGNIDDMIATSSKKTTMHGEPVLSLTLPDGLRDMMNKRCTLTRLFNEDKEVYTGIVLTTGKGGNGQAFLSAYPSKLFLGQGKSGYKMLNYLAGPITSHPGGGYVEPTLYSHFYPEAKYHSPKSA